MFRGKIERKIAFFPMLALFGLAIPGCANYTPTQDTSTVGMEYTEVVGLAVFYGEFRIYDSEDAFHNDEFACLSGSLPLKLQRQAAKMYDRKIVTVKGQLQEWPTIPDLLSLRYEGSEIQNGCNGDQVLFASSISEATN